MDEREWHLYRHFDRNGDLLYVGTALCAVLRNDTHRRQAPWFPEVSNISIMTFSSKAEAMTAEARAVIEESPRYNVRLTGRGKIAAPRTDAKNGRLVLRVVGADKAALAKAAEEDKRSLSSMVEKIIADWLKRHPRGKR